MYTTEQIEEWKTKSDKWDKLGANIAKCYVDENGDDENPEIPDADLVTIGEMAATAYGWLL